MTKSLIMFYLQIFILKRRDSISRSLLDTFGFDVENLLKVCDGYYDFIAKLLAINFFPSVELYLLGCDFVKFIFEIERTTEEN